MEHMAWKGRIKPGCKAEYQRRHAEIWPEMVKVLKEAGICNYSIFYCKDELFGYYECEKGVAYTCWNDLRNNNDKNKKYLACYLFACSS